MNLTDYTLEQFLACPGGTVESATTFPRDVLIERGSGLRYPPIKTCAGYTFVLLNKFGDVAVVDKNGDEAGFYSGNSLIVHDEHQGQGLATALVLHANVFRNELPKSRSLTEGGKQSLTRAWQVAHGLHATPWWP